jgi:hypothetical protein
MSKAARGAAARLATGRVRTRLAGVVRLAANFLLSADGAIAIAAVGAVATAVTWALWPRPAVAPRSHARTYLDVTACLLTDPAGVAPGTPGAAAWKAMQRASLATHVMVSYLPDTGSADAGVMLNTLAQRHCGVIVTTGTAARRVIEVAKANPHEHFVLVAAQGAPAATTEARSVPSSTGPSNAVPSNTVMVSAADAARRIDQAIRALAPT